MIDESKIIKWLTDEGLLNKKIQDQNANFHYIINYPQDHMMDLIQPVGKEDMILIGCATEIAEEQKKMISQSSKQIKENFIWAMRFTLNQFLVDFELEHPDNELNRFLITDEIFEDGLTKNELIHTIKRIYKSKLQCLWLIDKTFSSTSIDLNNFDNQ
ncbi:DUF2299 domain-containing protein [Methanobrevibacter boviskoreani]|uniref:DUF2299 domain-containing protein n=1 Tax=Methanobrevibacter boviskoreani TaxID=1348249 RepID=UPI0023F0AF64|nr:DUF2299 domain-containing protein [Methanobrevibacter boviskoreani]MDD6257612.1 DUF2299 domain-containing protein [Methanobrevibacter boviskoreani]MDY5614404.1 DUF2299 domain-containing protein [Methanobrevibacter boviskoreani]